MTTTEADSMMAKLAELAKVWDYKNSTLHVNKCKCSICPMQDENEVALQEQLTALIDNAKQETQK